MLSAPFTWTKAGLELEIGFGDFEHLAAPFRPLGYVRDLRDDRICRPGRMSKSGRERDSLITAETSLIVRFDSL
jgi:hypothetical protein